jgi:glycosyltransferase involved in cell wall biosynthesis
MVRVCMAATTFPRWAGDGEGAFVWGLAHALVQQGAVVRVVALHSPGAATHEVIDGVEVLRPRYWWPEYQESLRRGGGGLPVTLRDYPFARVQLPGFLAVYSRAVARVARACDVLHAHWTLSGAVGLLTRRRHRRPIVVTVQGSDVYQIPKLPLGGAFTRWVLANCQQVTALSASLQEAAAAAGIEREQIEVIPNGVDVGALGAPALYREREPVLLFVGYLIERKGVRYLLEAAPAILAQHPDLRIVLIGKGPEEQRLREQAAALGIAGSVAFVGFLPHAEVIELMQRSLLLVLPSVEEGQGAVLLEALAAGTPVIGSNIDGIAEVITPQVGRLFPVADAAALADRVNDLLAAPACWQQTSDAARSLALATYDWRVLAQRYLALYGALSK